MELLGYLWSQWIFVAFLAPFFWAWVNIIDVYFVRSVYEDEWDGIIINSLFQLIPWALPIFGIVTLDYPGLQPTIIAFCGGAFLALSFFFYFKTLFVSSDVVVVQAIWNLSVPLVPFLAWLLIGERLEFIHYVGITLAFFGASLLATNKEIKVNGLFKVARIMLLAVMLFSLSMVFQAEAYDRIGDFWTGFLIFSTGAALTGFFLAYFDKKPLKKRMGHIFSMAQMYFLIFLLAESLNLLAVLSSQRAIDISPAVSFVALIESSAPIFVLFLSFGIASLLFFFQKKKAVEIYSNQLVGFKTKIIACCIIALGIYLIS